MLATARRSDVVRAWAGLGYHRRAVSLHDAARQLAAAGGHPPRAVAELQRLPGVGPYTAAAVASIAFGVPAPAIDTNLRRVLARAAHGVEPDEVPAAAIAVTAAGWIEHRDPGAWNQALMDLGREVCRPVSPRCDECPLRTGCDFARSGRSGRRSARRQQPFAGSNRQVRGAVLAVLRDGRAETRPGLQRVTGFPAERITAALDGLAADGLVTPTGTHGFRLVDDPA